MKTCLHRSVRAAVLGIPLAAGVGALYGGLSAQAPAVPKYFYDPDWPKPLPNQWKIGGVTGLAVDKDDNVWALNRPNDLTDIEVHAELTPPTADCACGRRDAHFDRPNLIGSLTRRRPRHDVD